MTVAATGLGDEIATCQHCRLSITRRPGDEYWVDVTGWELCPKSGLHKPAQAGEPGAPVEVPGMPIEPEPIPTHSQWRLP